jgi:CelD/BcsL family acetyltransferase involved in cellulose biosynthesis
VLRLVFDWLDEANAAIVELGDQTGEGAYAEALAAQLHGRSGVAWLSSAHARALFVRAASDEIYLRRSVSSGKLKELRRQERRLGEKGKLRFEGLSLQGDVEAAIVDFLELERAGWKGPAGTAMSCRQADRDFFADVVREAWRSDRLRMSTLRLGGRAVAMKCNFLTAPGSCAFKIAYAEELSQYSPGVLLEVDNIRRLHAEPRVQWMDSCAAPGHPMIEHLWKERRLIQSWVLPLRPWGRLATAGMPLLQWLVRTVASASKRRLRSTAS